MAGPCFSGRSAERMAAGGATLARRRGNPYLTVPGDSGIVSPRSEGASAPALAPGFPDPTSGAPAPQNFGSQ
jgi:hypothetical protein